MSELGLCRCGCGNSTRIAPQTVSKRGWRKGEPIPFVSGHNLIGQKKTDEHRRAISESLRHAWATKRARKPLGSIRYSNGYILVKVREGGGRWDKQHVLIMEAIIGRKLVRGEQIHHVNGQRADNRPDNLFLCDSLETHSRIHASFDVLLGGLIKDGIVGFDRERGKYYRCR